MQIQKLRNPIVWGGIDPFTHLLIVGPTRCGKTATVIKPIIYQLLMLKAKGVELGLSVIEPKGDIARMVKEISDELNLDCIHIDPYDEKNDTRFNIMEGDMNTVIEATVAVLKAMFGKQEAFFATVQESAARNTVKLLKLLHGDNMDIIDVLNTLRDEKILESKVAELKAKVGMNDTVHFFETELLGSMREKYRSHVLGLRVQLENIVSNDRLKKILTGKSSINIDEHYEKGGILAINTALGLLRSSGDAFGQFATMHLQNGTFRRPGTEETRIPHFLIIDEYSRYINPDIETFLSIAAEFKTAFIGATQSLKQLEVASGKYDAQAIKSSIINSCRNKIAFGGLSFNDAEEFSNLFGKDRITMRQNTYKNNILMPNLFPDSYRDTETEEVRFTATDLIDGLPRFNFVYQLCMDGTMQKPKIGKGSFVPKNWRELREWEEKPKVTDLAANVIRGNIKDFKKQLNERRFKLEKERKNINTLTLEKVDEQAVEEYENSNHHIDTSELDKEIYPKMYQRKQQLDSQETEIQEDNIFEEKDVSEELSPIGADKELDGWNPVNEQINDRLEDAVLNKAVSKTKKEYKVESNSNIVTKSNADDGYWE